MTLEQQKEQLSNRFIGILAINNGYVIDKPEMDLGIDYQLKKTRTYTTPTGKTRYTVDPRYIDIQLKATTVNSIIEEDDSIKYDLEAKNFNDMVDRMSDGIAPLILILFVLPENQSEWVGIDENEIKLRKNAFWYRPNSDEVMTSNTSTKRISIPKSNMLNLNCFNNLHSELYPL